MGPGRGWKLVYPPGFDSWLGDDENRADSAVNQLLTCLRNMETPRSKSHANSLESAVPVDIHTQIAKSKAQIEAALKGIPEGIEVQPLILSGIDKFVGYVERYHIETRKEARETGAVRGGIKAPTSGEGGGDPVYLVELPFFRVYLSESDGGPVKRQLRMWQMKDSSVKTQEDVATRLSIIAAVKDAFNHRNKVEFTFSYTMVLYGGHLPDPYDLGDFSSEILNITSIR